MQVIKEVKLTKPARKSGGDRYEAVDGSLTIYIPQDISRPEGAPVMNIKITFELGD